MGPRPKLPPPLKPAAEDPPVPPPPPSPPPSQSPALTTASYGRSVAVSAAAVVFDTGSAVVTVTSIPVSGEQLCSCKVDDGKVVGRAPPSVFVVGDSRNWALALPPSIWRIIANERCLSTVSRSPV